MKPRRVSSWWEPWLCEVAAALRRETVGFNRRELRDQSTRAVVYRRTLLRRREDALGKAASQLLATDLQMIDGIMRCDAELRRRGHPVPARDSGDGIPHSLDTALAIVAGEVGEEA